MRGLAILLIALIFIFCIYYYLTRLHLEGFVETASAKKMLLEETDLQTFAGPSVREELMRLDPAFLEQQLEIYGQTRKIFSSIIETAAGAIGGAASPSASDKADAINSIAREAGGERPEFCGKARVDSLLDDPAGAAGLDRLFTCLPSTPGRLLLLLSYAARLLKEQIGDAGKMLGGDYAASAEEMPSFPIDTRNSNSNGSIKTEGFMSSSGNDVYISDYALPTVVPREGNNSSGSGRNPYKSAIENQLEAWKAAFDTESIKRIQLYIRYCNGVLKKIGSIQEDAKSGKLIKKMRYAERLNANNDLIASRLKADLPSAVAVAISQPQTGSFQLPL